MQRLFFSKWEFFAKNGLCLLKIRVSLRKWVCFSKMWVCCFRNGSYFSKMELFFETSSVFQIMGVFFENGSFFEN